MLAVGIDVGINGALAARDDKGNVWACVMPIIPGTKNPKPEDGSRAKRGTPSQINGDLVRSWLLNMIAAAGANASTTVVGIEAQQAMPKQGLVSTFHLGESYGLLQGIVKGLQLSMVRVKPKQWKKTILPDTAMDKSAAIAFVCNRFPTVNINVGKRKPIMHDGMADAICIAEYVYRTTSTANSIPIVNQ